MPRKPSPRNSYGLERYVPPRERMERYETLRDRQPSSLELTRRDPSRYDRDQSGGSSADLLKVLVGGLLVAGAGYGLWKLVLQPRLAQAQPQQPGGGPRPGSPNVNPVPVPPGTPGGLPLPPVPVTPPVTPPFVPPGPVPGGTVGDQVVAGDVVAVSAASLAPTLGGLGFGGLPSSVNLTVTSATPGNPMLVGTTDGITVPQATVPFMRSNVTAIVSHGGAPPAPVPVGPVPPVPPLVIPPGVLPVPSNVLPQDLGDPMNVQAGHRYRARIELDALTALAANPQLVAQQLQANGLSDVQVWGMNDQLPADWPMATVIAQDSQTYYAQGTAATDGAFPRPPQVAYVWEG